MYTNSISWNSACSDNIKNGGVFLCWFRYSGNLPGYAPECKGQGSLWNRDWGNLGFTNQRGSWIVLRSQSCRSNGRYLFKKMTFRLFFSTLLALCVISLKIAICLTIYALSMINKGLDHEQSLFFLGPSSKTPETRKWPRHDRLVSCVSRLRR